jgi:hypothetical protein
MNIFSTNGLKPLCLVYKYKEFIKSEIKQYNEMGEAHIDSSTHYIAIHKIQVNCYYLSDVGSGRGKGANMIIDQLCKKDYAFSYNGKYDLCWFSIPVFYKYYSDNPKGKRIDHHKLESDTVKEWLAFYEVEGSVAQPRVRDLLSKYSGFNPESEIEDFLEYFNLPSIQVFSYNASVHRYENECVVYKCKSHRELGEYYTGNFVRIAIVQVDPVKLHSGEKITLPVNHVIYLKDLSFLNLRVCENYPFVQVCCMTRLGYF